MKQSPVVIFHLGFQKTGTTTIQRFLQTNEYVLSEECIVIPKERPTRAIREPFLKLFEKGDQSAIPRISDVANLYVDKVMTSNCQCGIISDENIIGRNLYNPHGHIFDFACRAIQLIETSTRRKSIDLRFVFYTREFSSWLKSAYQQSVRTRRYQVTFDDWRRALPFDCNWHTNLCAIQQCTNAKVVFTPMEEDLRAAFLGARLLQEASVSSELLKRCKFPHQANEALPYGAIEFLRKLNATKLDRRSIDIVRKTIIDTKYAFKNADNE